MLINASLQNMSVYTGVMVLYADEESFTVMTAEGLPEAGWNTFSSYQDERIGSKVQSRTTAELRFRALLSEGIADVRFERM